MSEWQRWPPPFDLHEAKIVSEHLRNAHPGLMGAVIETTYMHAGRRYEVEVSNGCGVWREIAESEPPR